MRAVPPTRLAVFAGIVAAGLAADLATKRWMFDWLGYPSGRPGNERWLWTEVFGFQTVLNEGALFGVGQGFVWGFAALSLAALIGIALWLSWGRAIEDWLLTIALGSITAGILGNLWDRLALHGIRWRETTALHLEGTPAHAVRDWVLMKFFGHAWPNYNLADVMLLTGAVLLIWHALHHNPSQPPSPTA